jgi:hypothetical protein
MMFTLKTEITIAMPKFLKPLMTGIKDDIQTESDIVK